LQNSVDSQLVGDFEKDQMNERLGKLRGGLCIIKAGGVSQVEMNECRDRIEDAVFAVRAALQDGYVPGAGYALYQASQHPIEFLNQDQKTGIQIVQKAC
jgi:chaperonin GroEL